MKGIGEGTSTVLFINKSEVPVDRFRNVAYRQICHNYREDKEEPNRAMLTVGVI